MEEWRYGELYELEDRHWWFRARRHVIWSLLGRSGHVPAPRILDAGCGTGRNLAEFGVLGLAEGVDMSAQAVELCQERGLTGVRQGDLEDLPFEDGRFDLVIATDVIEHLDDDRLVLRELRRVAAPGARLVVTVPAYQWLWTEHDVSMHHRRRYTTGELRRAAIDGGWTPVIDTYFYTSLLLPVMLIRALRRLRPPAPGSSDLSLTPGALDRWLDLPVRCEAWLIKRGVRLPVGVSVGMVCVAT